MRFLSTVFLVGYANHGFLVGMRSLRLPELERFVAKKGAKIRDKVDKIVPLSQAASRAYGGAADGRPRRFIYAVETKWLKMVGKACFEDEGWNRACNLTPLGSRSIVPCGPLTFRTTLKRQPSSRLRGC